MFTNTTTITATTITSITLINNTCGATARNGQHVEVYVHQNGMREALTIQSSFKGTMANPRKQNSEQLPSWNALGAHQAHPDSELSTQRV